MNAPSAARFHLSGDNFSPDQNRHLCRPPLLPQNQLNLLLWFQRGTFRTNVRARRIFKPMKRYAWELEMCSLAAKKAPAPKTHVRGLTEDLPNPDAHQERTN